MCRQQRASAAISKSGGCPVTWRGGGRIARGCEVRPQNAQGRYAALTGPKYSF